MRDNNIGKKADTVPSKQIIVTQNLVHIRKYDYSKKNAYQIEKMSNVTVILNRQQKPSRHNRVKILQNISIKLVQFGKEKTYK